jgi:phosphoenolpyruvate carboxykinase (ATP)
MSWITAQQLGLTHVDAVHRNLDYDSLIEYALANEEAKLSKSGAMMIDTGIFTGRSPKDKYFVDQFPSNQYIGWGEVNKPITTEVWNELYAMVKEYLSGKKLFVNDVFAGSSDSSRRNIRFITEIAWQSHFVKNMFIEPAFEDLIGFAPDFTFYNACKITNPKYKEHGLNSDVFIVFNIEEKIAIIGGDVVHRRD